MDKQATLGFRFIDEYQSCRPLCCLGMGENKKRKVREMGTTADV